MTTAIDENAAPISSARSLLSKRLADFQQYIGHSAQSDDDDDDGTLLYDTLPLIGMVVMLFNALEKSVDRAICESINDRTDSVGVLVINGMNFMPKVDLYRRLCEDRHAAIKGPVPAFTGLVKRLEEAAKLRNLVVHADWITSDAKGFTYTQLHIKRGRMQEEYAQLTPEAMNKVADAIKGASDQFHAYLEQRDELVRDKRGDVPTA